MVFNLLFCFSFPCIGGGKEGFFQYLHFLHIFVRTNMSLATLSDHPMVICNVSWNTTNIVFFFPSQNCISEIWDALRAAAEADLQFAQAIVDSAGVIVQSADLTICYDERGASPFPSLSTLSLFIFFLSMIVNGISLISLIHRCEV